MTEAVAEEITQWQNRPLEAFYPVIYLDALVVKVRDQNRVVNRHAHIAVGVDVEGVKHVLGIWVQAAEGAKFWAGVLAFGAVALALIDDPFVVLWAVGIGLVVAVLATAVPRARQSH